MTTQKITRICENCGDPFKIYLSHAARGRGRFCSRRCADEAKIIPLVVKDCLHCGRRFEVPRCEVGRSKRGGCFCSQPCWRAEARLPLAVRFQKYIGETTARGCILWTGASDPDGRGTIWVGGPENQQISAPAAALLLAGRPVPKGLCALHRCDNPPCVNVEHLFAGSRFDNARDMLAKGRNAHGERHGFAKLTDAIVREARKRYGAGGMVTFKELAEDYGVTPGTMGLAISGITWKHLNVAE